jgi:hypothetical protein
LRGKSRSLANDDIQGAKPKQYGGTSQSYIVNDFAGVSSGMQQRLRESEAPWGAGGNFDTTSYGKKWTDKSAKYCILLILIDR